MKKGVIICVATCLAAVAITLLVLMMGNRMAVRELTNLSAEDIKEATVLANPPGKGALLGEKELAELIGILNDVTVYRKDNSYNEYTGQWVEFTITKMDGTQLDVAAYAPFIIIDGQGYQAKYKPCQAMNGLANRIIEAAPVNLEQEEMEILVADDRVLSSQIMPEEKVLYGLLPEEEETIQACLTAGEWKQGSADCANDCVVLVNGDEIRYHSECGTFNDNKSEKHLELTENDKAVMNEILQRYITLGLEMPAEEEGAGQEELPTVEAGNEVKQNETAVGQEPTEINAGGAVCEFVKMIKVKDRVYISTDAAVDVLRCGIMDGVIDSTVGNGEFPEENNQSNFGTGFGYQICSADIVDVYIDGEWIMFTPIDCEIYIDSGWESEEETPLMTVTSDKYTIGTYEMFASSYTWGEYGWLCACGMDPASSLEKVAEELPNIIYAEDLSVSLRENVELLEMVVYDKNFQPMEAVTELAGLGPGKYYVCYRVEEKGRFIEKEEQYEVTTYYCVFELCFSGANAHVR